MGLTIFRVKCINCSSIICRSEIFMLRRLPHHPSAICRHLSPLLVNLSLADVLPQSTLFPTPFRSVSSIVVGGSNTAWGPEEVERVREAVRGGEAGLVLLQREVPEEVNIAAAEAAAAAGIRVIQVWMPLKCVDAFEVRSPNPLDYHFPCVHLRTLEVRTAPFQTISWDWWTSSAPTSQSSSGSLEECQQAQMIR